MIRNDDPDEIAHRAAMEARAKDGFAGPVPTWKGWAKTPDYGHIHPLDEPPEPPGGQLVPGSRFSDEQWARAAYMIAAGCPFIQVARTMGCSRSTLWRAYTPSPDFRHRIAWEKRHHEREARQAIRSLHKMVAVQIETAVSRGDMKTVRWAADRLGMMDRYRLDDDDPMGMEKDFSPTAEQAAEMAALPEREHAHRRLPYGPDDWLDPDIADPDVMESGVAESGFAGRAL
ncbi:hypothetical protein [Azospirillum rugosum]|uniref:Homeodomain-like domain-containing protein n=1 Tax=Azospirillum rugosum TaxID=416170 RepID=A0ABS4SPM8_9PROT|nr:hypothetical protein [Azospirillum rugosum]MBP2294504.1 hypothetical protein [Azospirillum rugosum]MDQ0529009.1 hypothetical protein [Azospirillum rugosum]